MRTPKNLKWRLKEGDWFLREIVSQGKVLYEKESKTWIRKAAAWLLRHHARVSDRRHAGTRSALPATFPFRYNRLQLFSPANPFRWAIPTRWPTRSATPFLDHCLAADPTSRVACETMVTTDLAIVSGEITTKADLSREPSIASSAT